MRFNIGRPSTGGTEAAYRRFHENNPNYVADWRRLRREKSGAPKRPVGRPKKCRPNFGATVIARNKTLIRKRGVNYELVPDEDTDDIFELRKSNIHGIGVFLLDAVPAETFLMKYKGELISTSESDVRERHYKADGTDIYFFGTQSKEVIDATNKGNVARFINHCCEPNCIAEPGTDNRSVLIFSLRALEAEEEITIDYKLDPGEVIPCKCEARTCKKYI